MLKEDETRFKNKSRALTKDIRNDVWWEWSWVGQETAGEDVFDVYKDLHWGHLVVIVWNIIDSYSTSIQIDHL